MRFLSWIRTLQQAFGTPFLLLIFSVYWTQGFRSFPWTGINVLVKDELKLGPAAAQLMTSTAYIPWSIKPLYGIVSDCIPIRGQRRVPYIIIANILTIAPWLVLATVQAVTASPSLFTILLVCQNIGAAMADVVVDAMVAESTNKDKEAFAGDLQALSWFSLAIGGILGSLLGGPALKTLRPQGMFALFSICPIGQLILCLITNERSLLPDSLEEGAAEAERRSKENDEESIKLIDSVVKQVTEESKVPALQNGDAHKGFLLAIDEHGASENLLPKEEFKGEVISVQVSPSTSVAVSPQAPASRPKDTSQLKDKKAPPGVMAATTSSSDVGQKKKKNKKPSPSNSTASPQSMGTKLKPSSIEDHDEPMIRNDSEGSGLRRRSTAASGLTAASEADATKHSPAQEKGGSLDEGSKKRYGKGGEFKQLWQKMRRVVATLWEAVLNPEIHRPMLWFMASCALVPSLQTTMFYYQTNALNLEVSFLGTARVVGWGGLMLGTYIYNSKLKYVPMRRVFKWVHIVMALVTLTDALLTSRLNVRLGIPDKVFVLGASALGDAITQFRFMPFLILSARLCPPGIEGTLFALFMSAYNFGNTLSGYVGATLASRLGITSSSFSNLTLAIVLQSASNILPILLLSFVPSNISGAGDEKHVVREVKISPSDRHIEDFLETHTSPEEHEVKSRQ